MMTRIVLARGGRLRYPITSLMVICLLMAACGKDRAMPYELPEIKHTATCIDRAPAAPQIPPSQKEQIESDVRAFVRDQGLGLTSGSHYDRVTIIQLLSADDTLIAIYTFGYEDRSLGVTYPQDTLLLRYQNSQWQITEPPLRRISILGAVGYSIQIAGFVCMDDQWWLRLAATNTNRGLYHITTAEYNPVLLTPDGETWQIEPSGL